MCLSFAPHDNKYYKMVSNYGKLSRTSTFCPFGKSFVSADRTW